jgi:hypothetical protein
MIPLCIAGRTFAAAAYPFGGSGGWTLALPSNKSLRDNIGEAAMQVHLEIPEDLVRQLGADPSAMSKN